jgi:hypothetical protein
LAAGAAAVADIGIPATITSTRAPSALTGFMRRHLSPDWAGMRDISLSANLIALRGGRTQGVPPTPIG